jgi:hypothetical protein
MRKIGNFQCEPEQIGRFAERCVLPLFHFFLAHSLGIYDLPLRIFGIDDNPLEAIPAEVLEGGSQSVFDFLGARKY